MSFWKNRREKRFQQRRPQTAIHEAGHVIIALALLPDLLDSAMVATHYPGKGNNRGLVCMLSYEKNTEMAFYAAILNVAGRQAELVLCGSDNNGWYSDYETANELMLAIMQWQTFRMPDGVICSGQHMIGTEHGDSVIFSDIPVSHQQYLQVLKHMLLTKCEMLARQLVAVNGVVIREIASTLLEEHALSGDELRERWQHRVVVPDGFALPDLSDLS